MIQSQGIGDLYRIDLTSQRDGLNFNLAYIPSRFNQPHSEEFDTEFMKKLYALGYDMAKKNHVGDKTPPEYQTE